MVLHVKITGYSTTGSSLKLGEYLFDSFDDLSDELARIRRENPTIVRLFADIAI